MHAGVMSTNPTNKRTATLKQTTDAPTPKAFRRQQLSRARKARARLRQQNKMRLAVVRNN